MPDSQQPACPHYSGLAARLLNIETVLSRIEEKHLEEIFQRLRQVEQSVERFRVKLCDEKIERKHELEEERKSNTPEWVKILLPPLLSFLTGIILAIIALLIWIVRR